MTNYPNGLKIIKTNAINQRVVNLKKARLGANFEEMINESNLYYLTKGLAIIHKKPTPVQIVKVDFPARSKARITEAYYKKPSTTDYNGIYKGKYIDFEAKSCQATSFPFSHLFLHQITHLFEITKHGGISFLLIEFIKYQEIYLLPTKYLMECYLLSLNGGRKSIPYQYFKEKGYLITPTFKPRINYLKVVDYLITNELDY